MLEVLGDIVIAQSMLKDVDAGNSEEVDHPLDANYKKIGNELTTLNRNSKVKKKKKKSLKTAHLHFSLFFKKKKKFQKIGIQNHRKVFRKHKDTRIKRQIVGRLEFRQKGREEACRQIQRYRQP